MGKTAFAAALDRDVPLVIDGGLATQLEAQGCDISNPLWSASLLLDQPDAIVAASRAFLDAGAECIATASYQASHEGFAQRGLSASEADELMLLSVTLAMRARSDFLAACPDAPLRPLVAASIGPYGAMLHDGSEYRGDYGVSAATLRDFHEKRLRFFDTSDADVLACETVPSLLEARVLADLLAGCETPSWVSFSCCDGSHISDGTPVEEAAAVFGGHDQVLAVGLNCTPPRYATELVGRFSHALAGTAIVAYPNSGEVWNADTGSWSGLASPLDYARAANEWIAAGASIVGGCCRTGPGHIAAIRAALTSKKRPA
jgi:homocysteine S-methyltransferase